MATLEFELRDEGDEPLGYLERLTEPVVSGVLNGGRIITLQMDATQRRARHVSEHRARIRAYLDGEIIANTIVLSCQDEGSTSGATLKVSAADPLAARLARRTMQAAATYTAIDQGAIVANRIAAQDARAATGIRTSVLPTTTGVLRTLTFEQDKPELEAIRDMQKAFDGFDIGIVPSLDACEAGYLGDLGIWSSRGETRERIWLEIGNDGKENIESYVVDRDASKVTTDQVLLGKDAARVTNSNLTARATYGTILDSVDTYSDLTDLTLLGSLRDRLLLWRAQPKRVVTIAPAATAQYLPFRDFEEGDYLNVTIDHGRYTDELAIRGLLRAYGFSVGRDESGAATLKSLTVTESDTEGGS